MSEYKLAPVEPTDEMWQTAFELYDKQYHQDQMQSVIICIKEMYKAMIKAAPTTESITIPLAEYEQMKKGAAKWSGVSFPIEQAIKNGCCPFDIEDAYENVTKENT
jgi:hypothetical protein